MNGFSNGQFDTSVIERGMLITVTSQHGGSKSGIVTNVTAERIRYSLLDSFLGSFQEDEVTAYQVSEGILTFIVRKHLHTDAKVSQGTRQEAKRSVKEMLQNDFDLDTLASLIKDQRDAKVVAYIFSQLGELTTNQNAKLFVSINDTITLAVQKELGEMERWSEEKKQELEARVSHLLESYVQKQGNHSEPSFENPLEDLFEKLSGGLGGLGGFGGLGGGSNPLTDMLEELKNGKNPLFDLFGGGFGQGKQQTQMPQEMVDQLKEVLRQIFNDDNNKPGGRF